MSAMSGIVPNGSVGEAHAPESPYRMPAEVARDNSAGSVSHVTVVRQERGLLHSGYLWKRGMGWTKRWFAVYDDGHAYHYLTPEDTMAKGSIPLINCAVQPLDQQDYSLQGYFGFAIVAHGKKRVLYASSGEDMLKWIQALHVSSCVTPRADDRSRAALVPNGVDALDAGGGGAVVADGDTDDHGQESDGPSDARSAPHEEEDEEWEVDEEGYRVRRRRQARRSHLGSAGLEEDEVEEDEEFKPAYQFTIRSQEDALHDSTEHLKMASETFKMSAPPAPRGRSRRLPRGGGDLPPQASAPGATTPATAAPVDWASTDDSGWAAELSFPPAAEAFGAEFDQHSAFTTFPTSQPLEGDGGDGQSHSAQALEAPASHPHAPEAAPEAPTTQAVSLMQRAMVLLEAARFGEGLRCVSDCLSLLTAAEDVRSRIPDIRFCAQYHVAICLLKDLAKLRTEDVNTMARLTALLAALPLLPQHRSVCLHMAIRHNLRAHNYGKASPLERGRQSATLQPPTPPGRLP